jgi:hypothetical protein
MEATMARAEKTTITKSYEGDVGGQVDDLRSVLSQLAALAVLVGIGWFVFG